MADASPLLEKLFSIDRFEGQLWWLNLLYFPVGICLAAIRFFVGVHALVVCTVLPRSMPLRSSILRTMSAIAGVVVTVDDFRQSSAKCKVIVSNQVSSLDHIVVDMMAPSLSVRPRCNNCNKRHGLSSFLTRCGTQHVTREGNTESSFVQEAEALLKSADIPIFCQPEGTTTNGRIGLLKFRSWAFSVHQLVQPVTIQVYRPLRISVTQLRSSSFADVWWTLFSPFTLYKLRFLPPVEIGSEESVEHFADRVQRLMATSLAVQATKYSPSDKTELEKKLAGVASSAEQSSSRTSNIRSRVDGRDARHPSNEEFELMVANIKSVLPQVPLDVIRKDLRKTGDADVTMTSLLEGTIAYIAEPAVHVQHQPRLTTNDDRGLSSSGSPQPPKASHAADTFAKNGKDRHQSLADRKRILLEGARRRYIEKHGLDRLSVTAADGVLSSATASRS